MSGDVAHSIRDISDDRATARGRSDEAVRRAQEGDRRKIDQIAHDVGRVSRDHAVMQDNPARYCGAGENGELRVCGADRDRR